MHYAFCILHYYTCRCGGTADALVSGSSEEIRVGSNPVTCTKQEQLEFISGCFCFRRDLKGSGGE